MFARHWRGLVAHHGRLLHAGGPSQVGTTSHHEAATMWLTRLRPHASHKIVQLRLLGYVRRCNEVANRVQHRQCRRSGTQKF